VPATVTVLDGDVRVTLAGPAALAALKRELRFPLASVRSVSAGPFEERPWRLLGTAEPFTRKRYGRFRRGGRRFFLALNGHGPTLLLELERARAGYDAVAVTLDDAERVAAEIAAALP
jgi:hypothetical protein